MTGALAAMPAGAECSAGPGFLLLPIYLPHWLAVTLFL